MPCYDPRQDLDRTETVEIMSMLCSACRVLERLGYDFDENPALSQWWDKHKKEDGATGHSPVQTPP